MALNRAKPLAVKCLTEGRFHAEDRKNQREKNLLAILAVPVDRVVQLIQSCKGHEYEERDHDSVPGIKVHIMKPQGWYIKFYFIEPDCIFISVHK